ncbi:MAG: LytR/AlgR family response regulator transcription factor [Gammaproteobacteria bacterium]
MTILIADDEALARERLRSLLVESGYDGKIDEAEHGLDVLNYCAQYQPDILLLDIRMPVMDGLEAAYHLAKSEKPPAVIFTTAYGDHALAAFEANAIDYLLKPIRSTRLQQALEKAHKLNARQLDDVGSLLGKKLMRNHISARVKDSVQLVPVKDVIYFMAEDKYVLVKHKHGELLIDEPLISLEKEFNSQFTRIHRNALIRKDYLIGVEKSNSGHFQVLLHGTDDKPEISRRHTSTIRKMIRSK